MAQAKIVGSEFIHRFWLNPENMTSLRCRITRCANGGIYYRPVYGKHDDGTDWLGSPVWFDNAQHDRYVKEYCA